MIWKDWLTAIANKIWADNNFYVLCNSTLIILLQTKSELKWTQCSKRKTSPADPSTIVSWAHCSSLPFWFAGAHLCTSQFSANESVSSVGLNHFPTLSLSLEIKWNKSLSLQKYGAPYFWLKIDARGLPLVARKAILTLKNSSFVELSRHLLDCK